MSLFRRRIEPIEGLLRLAIGSALTCASEQSDTQDAISSAAFVTARIALSADRYGIPKSQSEYFPENTWPALYNALAGELHIATFVTQFVKAQALWQEPGLRDAILPFYEWREPLRSWAMPRSSYFTWMTALLAVLDDAWMKEERQFRR